MNWCWEGPISVHQETAASACDASLGTSQHRFLQAGKAVPRIRFHEVRTKNAPGWGRTGGSLYVPIHRLGISSFAPGIGKRLNGWANRDLNIGAIVSLAPNLKPFTDLLGVDVETVKKVLASWGPGRYDAELDKDGKAFRPDGKQAGTLIPPAFGLAGVNLATWTGCGSVTYWNAYVAGTEMHGAATFFDARFNDKGSISRLREERLGQYTQYAGQGHSQAGRAAPALDPGAEGTGRVI